MNRARWDLDMAWLSGDQDRIDCAHATIRSMLEEMETHVGKRGHQGITRRRTKGVSGRVKEKQNV